MKIYHYHPITKELLRIGIADRSPLDEEEVYLIPANATSVEPPDNIEGKAIVFDNGEWKHFDVEIVAEKDIGNSSPSTETAYQKMVNEMFDMAKEIQSIKHDIAFKGEKINRLEQEILKVNDKKSEV